MYKTKRFTSTGQASGLEKSRFSTFRSPSTAVWKDEALIKGHDAKAVIAEKVYVGDDFAATIEAGTGGRRDPAKEDSDFQARL